MGLKRHKHIELSEKLQNRKILRKIFTVAFKNYSEWKDIGKGISYET